MTEAMASARSWWDGFVARYGEPLKLVLATRAALIWSAWVGMVILRVNNGAVANKVPGNLFLNGWLAWDSGWYLLIAKNGYTNVPIVDKQVDVVFLPVYPMLVRGMAWVLGGNFELAAVLVSNLALLFAAAILYRWLVETKGPTLADHTLLLMLWYPYALFYSAAYTESVFLLETSLAIYAAHRQRWLVAGLALAAASATRTIGLMAVAPVGLMYLQQKGWSLKKLRPDVLFIGLGLCGLGGYMLFLHLQFGDAMAFTRAFDAKGWSAHLNWEKTKEVLTISVRAPWKDYLVGNFPLEDMLAVTSVFVATILTVFGWRRLGVPNLVWTLLVLYIYWNAWISGARYLSVHFPLFLLVAEWTLAYPNVYRFLLFAGGSLMVVHMVMFNHGLWVA